MPDILSNTSCLIALDNIRQLDILRKLYGSVHISAEVAAEFGSCLPAWIQIHQVIDRTKLDILHNLVDLGEASTIALACQFEEVTLILDDRKARKLAENLNLRFTGLLGVVIKAKQIGIIDSVEQILTALKGVGFRFCLPWKSKPCAWQVKANFIGINHERHRHRRIAICRLP
jgi:predicted nucleic acid-binding protein